MRRYEAEVWEGVGFWPWTASQDSFVMASQGGISNFGLVVGIPASQGVECDARRHVDLSSDRQVGCPAKAGLLSRFAA